MSQRRRVLDPDRAASDPARRSTGEHRCAGPDGPSGRSTRLVGAALPRAATGAPRGPRRSARPRPPAARAGCGRGDGRLRRTRFSWARSALLRPRCASAPPPLRSSPAPRPLLRAGAGGATPVRVGVVRSHPRGDVVAPPGRSVGVRAGGSASGPGRSPSGHLRGRPNGHERPSARRTRAVGARRRPIVLSAGGTPASERIRRLGSAGDRALAGSVPPPRRLSGRRQAPAIPTLERRRDPREPTRRRRSSALVPEPPGRGGRPAARRSIGSCRIDRARNALAEADGRASGRGSRRPNGANRPAPTVEPPVGPPDRLSLSHPPLSGRRRGPWPGRAADPLVARRGDPRPPRRAALARRRPLVRA